MASSQRRLETLSFQIAGKNLRRPRRFLITGAFGQLGTELVDHLLESYLPSQIICTDLNDPPPGFPEGVQCFKHDILDKPGFEELVKTHRINTIIHFAAMLSAVAERYPQKSLNVNLLGSLHALEIARAYQCQILIPSTIAAFGPSSGRQYTKNQTIMDPTTIYGCVKVSIELLGAYYYKRYGLDFRSLRFPGVASVKTEPTGGSTDYCCDIFYKAVQGGICVVPLRPNQRLPFLYIKDILRSVTMLLDAPDSCLKSRVYNVSGIDMTPSELYERVAVKAPALTMEYAPDYRSAIVDTWPETLDDTQARTDWGWHNLYNVEDFVEVMYEGVKAKLAKQDLLNKAPR